MLRIVDSKPPAPLLTNTVSALRFDNSTMSPYLQNPLDLGADIALPTPRRSSSAATAM